MTRAITPQHAPPPARRPNPSAQLCPCGPAAALDFLQVFVPITLIILISWFTFFLRDYSRRIEASAAKVLLFIALSFSLVAKHPRLGYITFRDTVMGVTLIVNLLVLLYNVNMKRLEARGGDERIENVDSILDWLYPLLYPGLIGLVILLFF